MTGASGRTFSEPTPYGMTLVKRGHLKMGIENQDTLWGKKTPLRDISVEGFWMDETEVTNSMYRQFVNYVRDSILRERLADPNYGGDETYKIEDADYLITAFGTVARVAKSAIDELRQEGIKAGLFRPITVWPFPYKELHDIIARDNIKEVLDVELNEGQMLLDVKVANDGLKKIDFFGHCGSEFPTTDEVKAKIREMAKEG